MSNQDKAGGRSPDYVMRALDKDTGWGKRAKIGAGWKNKDGSISIALSPFTVLQAGPNLVLTLFPAEKVVATTETYPEEPF